MSLSNKQRGVLKGVLIGIVSSLAVVLLSASMNPFNYGETLGTSDRLSVAVASSILPAIFLAFSIGRIAKYRFFSPKDIDGGGLSDGTPQIKVLQALLQNTLEQVLLAVLVYCSWAVIMPSAWLSAVPVAAIAFALGRILFFTGYSNGASSRAIGFTLSFYPSIVMLIGMLVAISYRQIS